MGTRRDVGDTADRVDPWISRAEHGFERLETRMDEHFRRLDQRLARCVDDMVRSQTRTIVFLQVITVVVIAVLAFGLR